MKYYKTEYTDCCNECDACTDVMSDFTNGDYLFLCNEAENGAAYDLDMGTITKCPRNKF